MMTTSYNSQGTGAPAVSACPPLAILDWGIGGLGFFKLLRARRPDVSVTYFSDSGEVPYGRLSKERLVERLHSISRFLAARGVTHLVAACNAVSTVLPVPEEDPLPLRITGVIEPTLRTIRESRLRRYGVIGGRRTVLSGSYRVPLTGRGKRVSQRIAQPLSRLIEDGKSDTAEMEAALARIVRPLKKIEALILACTHYSAVLDLFKKHLPDAVLIDPAEKTLAWIEERWTLPASAGPDVFYTTGSAAMMRSSARKAFGVDISDIYELSVDLRHGREGGCS